MSRYSSRRPRGLSNGTPCRPSTTCGPLTPSPSTKRSPEIAAMVMAVIAAIDGTRALICMIPVPRRNRSVRAARNASGEMLSCPHDSADQQKSTPSRSLSTAKRSTSDQSRRAPAPGPPMPTAIRSRDVTSGLVMVDAVEPAVAQPALGGQDRQVRGRLRDREHLVERVKVLQPPLPPGPPQLARDLQAGVRPGGHGGRRGVQPPVVVGQ